jgi:hypothetical protein
MTLCEISPNAAVGLFNDVGIQHDIAFDASKALYESPLVTDDRDTRTLSGFDSSLSKKMVTLLLLTDNGRGITFPQIPHTIGQHRSELLDQCLASEDQFARTKQIYERIPGSATGYDLRVATVSHFGRLSMASLRYHRPIRRRETGVIVSEPSDALVQEGYLIASRLRKAPG